MSYSKRTCYKCGYKDIQPNMRQLEIEYNSGSSQAGLSSRALISSTIFGSDKATNQVKNWFSGNTKRQYKRKKIVWQCSSNCGSKPINVSIETRSNISRKSTRTNKTITKIDAQINKIENIELNKLRIAEAEARIKELTILEKNSRTLIDWIFHSIGATIKILTIIIFSIILIFIFFG